MKAAILCAGVLFGAATLAAQTYSDLVRQFDYDHSAPLNVRETSVQDRGGIKVHDISYASPKGGYVPAYLIVPVGKGPFAAVIWGHWYWGNSTQRNRTEFLEEAVVLAKSGLMSLLYDGPIARPGHVDDRNLLGEQQIRNRIQTILGRVYRRH